MRRILLLPLLLAGLLATTPAQAETTLRLFGGVAIPEADHATAQQPAGAGRVEIRDVRLRTDAGASFGASLERWGRVFGVALEVAHYRPTVREQTTILDTTTPLPTTVAFAQADRTADVTLGTVSLLVRAPAGRWYPYLGLGLGAEHARVPLAAGAASDTALAAQARLGLSIAVAGPLSVFAEARLTWAEHTVPVGGRDRTFTFRTPHALGGLALRF